MNSLTGTPYTPPPLFSMYLLVLFSLPAAHELCPLEVSALHFSSQQTPYNGRKALLHAATAGAGAGDAGSAT